jgi:hypothetical protein
MSDLLDKGRKDCHWYLGKLREQHGLCDEALASGDVAKARKHLASASEHAQSIGKAIGAPEVRGLRTELHETEPGPTYGIDQHALELQAEKAALGSCDDYRKVFAEPTPTRRVLRFEPQSQKSASALGPGWRVINNGLSMSLDNYYRDVGKTVRSTPQANQVREMAATLPPEPRAMILKRLEVVEEAEANSSDFAEDVTRRVMQKLEAAQAVRKVTPQRFFSTMAAHLDGLPSRSIRLMDVGF